MNDINDNGQSIDKRSDPSMWYNDDDLLTPEEASLRLKVSPEHVRALIRTDQLNAINIGIGKKRPLYRIPSKNLDEFLANPIRQRKRSRRCRFKRLPPVEDHFPNLR